MKETELYPCPFCRAVLSVDFQRVGVGKLTDMYWVVSCWHCGMRGPVDKERYTAGTAYNECARRVDDLINAQWRAGSAVTGEKQ